MKQILKNFLSRALGLTLLRDFAAIWGFEVARLTPKNGSLL